jgi:hypothetical protein
MTMISRPNPFREHSKLHDTFEFMADGEWHTLSDIAFHVYRHDYRPRLATDQVTCRRVGSALRTIRATPGLDVNYHYRNGYQLVAAGYF